MLDFGQNWPLSDLDTSCRFWIFDISDRFATLDITARIEILDITAARFKSFDPSCPRFEILNPCDRFEIFDTCGGFEIFGHFYGVWICICRLWILDTCD